MTFSAKSLRRMLAAVGIASLITLSACGNDATTSEPEVTPTESVSAEPSPEVSPSASESPEPEESPTPTVEPSADLSGVEVVDGDVPEVKLPAPWGIESTQTKVLKEGTSAQTLTDTSVVTINYMGVNGTTGEVFDSSFERGEPATFSLEQVVPGFQKGLSGQKVGSRVLIGMVPEDGYAEGNPGAGIDPGTSLVFLVDIISANFSEAVGEAVPPAEGMPAVAMTDGKPEVTIPAGVPAPTELRAQPLIKGPGAAVTAESTVQVQYRAFNYADGSMWQDAWAPQSGQLSTLIEGWKQGLVGQTAGSRVLLVVPPALAFPDGLPEATPPLEAGQTLVYVIDILDVQN
ncbi:FKBP-type peptidyl-prolyl cis-trans isomerase [Tessaracoccus lubricantis]|uniref:peptidylprolyl isomerase n=1 Tax=Tessaracoccus lubricantis TaxID=545543 RepID=A0ABP9FIL7_9ACTN